jgi:hypothetical protein
LFSVKNFPTDNDNVNYDISSLVKWFIQYFRFVCYFCARIMDLIFFRLSLLATSDMYEIGFVRDADMQALMELTSSVGINLNFEW